MITIEKCKQILNKVERKFTDDEVKIIREFLYKISIIEHDKFKADSTKDSSNIHESID